MLRRVSCCLGFLVILACVMGADTVTMPNSVANPNGTPFKAAGDGTYSVDPANTYKGLIYNAKLVNTQQVSSTQVVRDIPKVGDWNASLILAPGVYDTLPILTSTDNITKQPVITSTPTATQITVK